MDFAKEFIQTLIGLPSVWKRQDKNWRTTVIRTSLERLGYQIIYPYLSIYIIALGATKTQLGWLTSIGLLLAGIVGPSTGRFIDRNGTKKVYITGILCLLGSYLIYFISRSWQLCFLSMILYYLGNGTAIHGCETICANCLDNCDRAKGMLICESLASGVLGMIGPMIAAFVLVRIVGVSEADAETQDIRWLFLLSATCTLISLLVIVFRLQNRKWSLETKKGTWRDSINILRESKNARKWLFIGAVHNLPQAMVLPYCQVFAGEVKGASVTVLATMVTATALSSIFFGYASGVLADKIGRKRIMYILIPLYWLSILLLVFGNGSPWMLILSGALQGFYYINGPISAAYQHELIAPEVMGTWLGTTRLTNAIVSACMALLSGVIYDKIGPQYVFLIYVGLDLFVRMPLLLSLPETLHARQGSLKD